ncbi:hypothetical protein [Sulfurimonas sp. HSL3-7]|uniref:hypothetical protein n=1 Tax=Sulfonitrofixus jiaomeiensis TaxID=3131938 RepID=UPI0031F7C546
MSSQEPIRAKGNLEAAKNFQKRTTTKRKNSSFAQKEIDVKAFILAPEGYEAFMFIIYFLTIPYLTGLAFLYLFVAKASFEHFLNVKLSSFFVIWAIGYEVVAAILLTLIAYSFIKSFKSVE